MADSPKRTKAAALRYDPARGDAAPRVVAAGDGAFAERIIARAEEAGVPLHEDPGLAAALALLEREELIPEELYLVIAQVLAWAYRVDQREGAGESVTRATRRATTS